MHRCNDVLIGVWGGLVGGAIGGMMACLVLLASVGASDSASFWLMIGALVVLMLLALRLIAPKLKCYIPIYWLAESICVIGAFLAWMVVISAWSVPSTEVLEMSVGTLVLLIYFLGIALVVGAMLGSMCGVVAGLLLLQPTIRAFRGVGALLGLLAGVVLVTSLGFTSPPPEISELLWLLPLILFSAFSGVIAEGEYRRVLTKRQLSLAASP